MQPDKLIFLSASDSMAELNTIKCITKVVLERQNALKIVSCHERLKDDLSPLCSKRIGINPFTRDNVEKEIVAPLLRGYEKVMEYLDEDWWVRQMEEYILSTMDALPPGVKFIATDCNTVQFLHSPLRLKHPLVRVEGTTAKTKSMSTPTSGQDYLNASDFASLIGSRDYFSLTMENEKDLNREEDLDSDIILRIKNLLQQINESPS